MIRFSGAAIVVAGLGFVLWSFFAPTTIGHADAACFLLIDRTESVNSPETADSYRTLAGRAIEGCRERSAVMLIGWIDQESSRVNLAGNPLDPEFRLHEGEGRLAGAREAQRDDETEAALQGVAAVIAFSAPAVRNTDLLAGIDQSATQLRLLGRKHQVERQYLIVLSDGVQISDTLSFEVFSEGESVAVHVEAVGAVGAISSLDGIVVNFLGTNTGVYSGGGQMPAWFVRQVEDFWQQAVASAGGQLCFYGPEATDLPVLCEV